MEATKSRTGLSGKLVVLLLLSVMVLMGLWASRPAPPPTLDDPQPLFQLFRQGVPRDLLAALPMRVNDEVRLVGDAPLNIKAGLFLADSEGSWSELEPVSRRQEGKQLRLAFPPLNPQALGTPPGTRLAVIAGGVESPLALDDLQAAFGREPWPELPEYTVVYFTSRGIEVTGPKGPKLPGPEATQEIVERLRAGAKRLAEQGQFFSGIAVPVRGT